MNADSRPVSHAAERSYQGNRDAVHSGRHRNEIAQRHHSGSRLSKLLPADRDQVETVTSALSIPATNGRSGSPGDGPGAGRSAGLASLRTGPHGALDGPDGALPLAHPTRSFTASWPAPPPRAGPLPGHLDRRLTPPAS